MHEFLFQYNHMDDINSCSVSEHTTGLRFDMSKQLEGFSDSNTDLLSILWEWHCLLHICYAACNEKVLRILATDNLTCRGTRNSFVMCQLKGRKVP